MKNRRKQTRGEIRGEGDIRKYERNKNEERIEETKREQNRGGLAH
jgi:hypothetical protein